MAQTPMMKQYLQMKEQNGDCILFFRLGDFYEMFGEDAKTVSKELDLVLTTRDRSAPEEERVPMCGVPYHSAEGYIARLLARGYKIAVCEQMEDPKSAKGLVKRDITRIITPGTAVESSMLEEAKNNFLASVYIDGEDTGVCFCDMSTGELYVTGLHGEGATSLESELGRFSPSEVVLCPAAADDAALCSFLTERLGCSVEKPDGADFERADEVCGRQFGSAGDKLLTLPSAAAAVTGLLNYLYRTQKSDLGYIRAPEIYERGKFMVLDLTARRNLELCGALRTGEKRGSLLWVLDRTLTPMGGRLLRSWVEKPLTDPGEINRRLDAVQAFVNDQALRDRMGDSLNGFGDMERTLARIAYGNANARDMRALAQAARRMPGLIETLEGAPSPLLCAIAKEADGLEDIAELVSSAIADDPPFSVREGGFIRRGYNAEVDRLDDLLKGGRGGVAAVEARERERTGIKTLKVGYNRVFGYYIEVRRSAGDKLPDDYIRKQTLVDRERYITPELKEMESAILTASERINALEWELFEELRARISAEARRIQRTAHAVAQADALRSLGETAAQYGYCRPEVDLSDVIEIRDGRHPVVERMLKNAMFVPNDTLLDRSENVAAIITGPNMAGKSTYMRQVALIVLMAQMGSFVPARSARIGIVDRIFTRIGASDDLAAGRSTFMVEMSEVAEIVYGATSSSLLILDEIGRGTSTFDGMAIARAVLEWVSDRRRIGARTLFATHYHELTALEDELDGVKNYNIAAKKRGQDIIFLRKIVRGGTDDSYGIEVARLAGLPDALIRRAGQVLEGLESGGEKTAVSRAKPGGDEDGQVSLGSLGSDRIAEKLRAIDLNVITPIEAMTKLYELKQEAEHADF